MAPWSSGGPVAACSHPRTCPLPAATARWLETPRSSRQLHIGHLHGYNRPDTDKTNTRTQSDGKEGNSKLLRGERKRERWRERCRNGLPPQPAKNSVRNTGEETLTESRPWGERVQPSRWPGLVGHFIPGMVRGPTSLPQPCPNTNPAEGRGARGLQSHQLTPAPHINMDEICPEKGMLCQRSGLLEEPCPPCPKACPTQGQGGHGGSWLAPSQLGTAPWWATRGHRDAAPGPPATGLLHPLPGQRGESPAGAAKSTD